MHNQQIQWLWRDVVACIPSLSYDISTFIKDNTILHPFNEIDLAIRHCVYMALINEKLDAWHHAWLKLRISTVKLSPLSLLVSDEINCSFRD